MRFIKGLIVTRIDYREKDKELIEKHFDLSLYKKSKNSYLLKESILNKHIKEFRKELLELSEGLGDSLEDSDAYILDTTVEELINNKIYLSSDNTMYYYEKFKDNKFETIFNEEYIKNSKIHIYAISLIWDVSNTRSEDETFFTTFVNNLVRKSCNNILKGACWFTITD